MPVGVDSDDVPSSEGTGTQSATGLYFLF